MSEKLKLLEVRDRIENLQQKNEGSRNGFSIEKGVVLNEEYLRQHRKEIGDMVSYFSAYPDCYLSLITPENENFELFFYQRIFLRAVMRFKTIYLVACRAFSKSFLTILALIL